MLDSTFSIEPYYDQNANLKLDYLQNDTQEIGKTLREGVHELAKQYLIKFEVN